MKEAYTHAGIAIIIALVMYALSFSSVFDEMKRNILAVFFMVIVMGTIGFFYAKLFYDERGDSYKK